MTFVSPEPPETTADERALALAGSALASGRRLLAGPDGPWTLAIVLALAAVLQLALSGEPGAQTSVIGNLLATLPLALARRSLLAAAWLVTFGTLWLFGDAAASLTLGGVVAQLTVTYLVATRRRRLASVLLATPFLLAAVASPPRNGGIPAAVIAVLVVAAQLLGDARRQRGQALAERDATRQAMTDTLREQAATQERARIARELHDVVAHHVSMVAVQAETARLTTPGMPPEGQERLAAIGDTARDALTEMRRLLGVLRADVAGEAERAPQPGLGRLDELLDGAREAGTSVRLVVDGDVVALPPGVDLTAYRIVQEALTNARRHAPGAVVEVELRFDADALSVLVRDDGPGATEHGPTHPGGHGILGMHERVAMVGGSLRVGSGEPGSGTGFAVEARLPIAEPAP
jgi:signal transduction histidine kinase